METYIALLRGINVSGQKKILMKDLKELLAELNYQELQTYIQSGNIIFKTTKTDKIQLEKEIKNKIFEKYSFEVPVIIRTYKELETIIANNPFKEEVNLNIEKLYLSFLSDSPEENKINKINPTNYIPDKFLLVKKELYLLFENSYGNTKLNNNFFENKLKVVDTTRNWKTSLKLLELAKEISKN